MFAAAKIKKMFFDRDAVIRALKDPERRKLSQAGAFIRTRARSLLRRRKKPSPAGSPPSVHSKDAVRTLKYILFGYDAQSQSVVVGPVKLNQVDELDGQTQGGVAPQVQEHGGTARVVEKLLNHTRDGRPIWVRRDRRRRRVDPHEVTRVRTAKYPPRPFMGPALQKEIEAGKISGVWAGAVKGGG